MEIAQVLILAIIQGITEFLPVSSSAHLILVPFFSGWPDQGLAFDIAVHAGTLLAILMYFRKEIWQLFKALLYSILDKKHSPESRLAWYLILATLPTAVTGFLVKDWITTVRSPLVIAGTTIGFGILLGLADYYSRPKSSEYQMRFGTVLGIACAQICALIPGVSRSGVTLSAGLALGLTRQAAARFSFYLSIPIITAAALLGIKDIATQHQLIEIKSFILGMGVAALSGLACIHLFLGWIEKFSLSIFVVYRLLLGIGLLYYFY